MQLVASSSAPSPRSFREVLRTYPAPQWALTLGITLGSSLILVLIATA